MNRKRINRRGLDLQDADVLSASILAVLLVSGMACGASSFPSSDGGPISS